MKDSQAERVALALLDLAVVVRDEGPDAVLIAARAVLKAAGNDPVAALVVAAALVDTEAPVRPWWQQPMLTPAPKLEAGHGTHAAYARHKNRGEKACEACLRAEAAYSYQRRVARKQRPPEAA